MVSFICLRGTVKGTRTTRRRSFSQNTASLKKLPRYMNWCVQLFGYFFCFCLLLFCFFLLFHVLLFHVFSLVSFWFCFVAWQRCAWCHWSVRKSVRNGLIGPRRVHIVHIVTATGGSVGWASGCRAGGREFNSGRTNTQGLKITEQKVLPL